MATAPGDRLCAGTAALRHERLRQDGRRLRRGAIGRQDTEISSPATTVVVVSYQPGGWLRACLESVTRQAEQVILVDNGSADQEASRVGAAVGVRVHRLVRNEGFVGGVNAGLCLVDTELVALLNDDAVALPGWLASAAEVLDDPTVAAVGPKIVMAGTYGEVKLRGEPWWAPGDSRPLGTMVTAATVDGEDVLDGLQGGLYGTEHLPDSRWRWTNGHDPVYVPLPVGSSAPDVRINGEPIPLHWVGDVINNAGSYLSQEGFGGDFGFGAGDKGDFDSPGERFGVTGAALVARKATFERIGGLASGFFAYYEDLDWCWRARLAGYRMAYDPAAKVRHVRSATTQQVGSDFFAFLARRNRLLCLVRNAPAGVVRDELMRALGDPSGTALRRSVLRRFLPHLAHRVHHSPPRGQRERVFKTWAGRDETWKV